MSAIYRLEEYYVDYKALQRYEVCERYIGGRSTTSIIRHYKGMCSLSLSLSLSERYIGGRSSSRQLLDSDISVGESYSRAIYPWEE